MYVQDGLVSVLWVSVRWVGEWAWSVWPITVSCGCVRLLCRAMTGTSTSRHTDTHTYTHARTQWYRQTDTSAVLAPCEAFRCMGSQMWRPSKPETGVFVFTLLFKVTRKMFSHIDMQTHANDNLRQKDMTQPCGLVSQITYRYTK